jgi:hypothetical protein
LLRRSLGEVTRRWLRGWWWPRSRANYARLFDEAPEHPVAAEEAIRAARRHLAQERLAV